MSKLLAEDPCPDPNPIPLGRLLAGISDHRHASVLLTTRLCEDHRPSGGVGSWSVRCGPIRVSDAKALPGANYHFTLQDAAQRAKRTALVFLVLHEAGGNLSWRCAATWINSV